MNDELIRWIIGGLAATGLAGFSFLLKRIYATEIRLSTMVEKSSSDMAVALRDINIRLNSMGDDRVRREDIDMLARGQTSMITEMQIVRQRVHDVSNIVHMLQGEIESRMPEKMR